MARLAGLLLLATTVYASTVTAAPAGTTCSDLLKRTCSPVEQIAFDRAASQPVAAQSRPANCSSFLQRACSVQESASYTQGTKRAARSTSDSARSCDAFLKRACSAQEKLHFARGASTQLALAPTK